MKRNVLLFHGILFFLYAFSLFSQTLPTDHASVRTTFSHDFLHFDLYAWVFFCFIIGYQVIKFTALLTNQSAPLFSFLFLIFSYVNMYSTSYLVLLSFIDSLSHLLISYIKIKRKEENITW